MAYSLDFNKVKRQYMTITLPDEEKTKLLLCTPTKALKEELQAVYSDFLNADTELNKTEAEYIDDLYSLIARLMSHNKTNKQISKDKLVELLELEDLIIFINSYLEFVNSVTSVKN